MLDPDRNLSLELVRATEAAAMAAARHVGQHPRTEKERRAALQSGHDRDRVLTTTDLVRGDNVVFAASGVTDGALLRGVRMGVESIVTRSLSVRSRPRTVRLIETRHDRTHSDLISARDRFPVEHPDNPRREAD